MSAPFIVRRFAPALVLWILGGLGGCKAPELQSTLSPPVASISGDPWKAADQIVKTVPNSFVVIGHGSSMEPLYPSGTTLVLRQLAWGNLRAGMTTIYCKDLNNPYYMVAHLLLNRELDEWVTQGLNNKTPDNVLVTEKNYVGTVIAAFRQVDQLNAQEVIRQLPSYQSGTCLMRCHIEGVRHGAALGLN